MLFPGSRIWYEGAVADLASLTEEIKSSGFTGHIVLEFQDSIDVVICVGGDFLRVIEKIGRRILTTKKYREIWGKCQIKQGRMTVFELPPRLVRRLREVGSRRLFRSGTIAGCDPLKMLDELAQRRFSGLFDCVGPDGKLLLDMAEGRVEACYYTAHAGLTHDGIAAFTAWHRSFVHSTRPWFFFVSDPGDSGSEQIWDQILMDSADQTPLPLASSIERLYGVYGRESAPGETLVSAGDSPAHAIYLMTGAVELFPAEASDWVGGAPLRAGEFLGLGWMLAGTPSPVTARASAASRFLALDAAALDVVVANSPMLAARMIREAAGTLASLRARLAAFEAEPRLRDVDAAVVQALERHPQGGRAGVPAAELFRELTQILPLPLQEIDALFRRLAALAGVAQSAGRVTLAPRQF